MKKIVVCLAVFSAVGAKAQTFTDDFESYTVGQYLGPQSQNWTTWSGVEGNTEDVQVTSNNASSGTKSIYLASAASNGGPQDVVLPFDQVYNSGNFTFEANFYVVANKGAYFNLQGTNTPGQVWALDCYMLNSGTLKLKNGSTSYLTANYPMAQWFNMRIEMDLTSNIWELFVDNVSQGSFSNPTGQIGILDLYPVNPTAQGGNGQSAFYVDDVSYHYISPNLTQLNGGITFIDQLAEIAGMSSDVKATVRNLGADTIHSFDITSSFNGSNVTESVSGVAIPSLATYVHTFAQPLTVATGTLTVTISNVNGAAADDNATDDSKTITSSPIIPALGKMVVSEEGTGTWCQYCPRGAVYMDLYEDTYSQFWTGIAVHNNDPMTVPAYDTPMGNLISGYPIALVDRGAEIDPSAMYSEFINRLQVPPVALLENGATWNPTTRLLTVSVSANFQSNATNLYKLACVLTEDSVTGTGSGYAQSNAYSGGGNGVMGGFESLPNPVPAAQMNYNHVARAISPSFEGQANTFPAVVNSGETHVLNFEFTLPASWDENQIHIVGMLIGPNGRIDNAGRATIDEAVANGFVAGETASITEVLNDKLGASFQLYPNPARENTVIQISTNQVANLDLSVLDLSGKQIYTSSFESVQGEQQVLLTTSSMNPGIYFVQAKIGESVYLEKLIIE